jgi:flagellin
VTVAEMEAIKVTVNGKIIGFDANAINNVYNTTTGIGTAGMAAMNSSIGVVQALTGFLNEFRDFIGVYGVFGLNKNTGLSDVGEVHLVAHEFGVEGNQIAISSNVTYAKFDYDTLQGGGNKVMTASAYYNAGSNEYELQIQMNHGGEKYQVQTFAFSAIGNYTTIMGGVITGSSFGIYTEGRWMSKVLLAGAAPVTTFVGLNEEDEWLQVQNGTGTTEWDGAEVLTQSNAQRALSALDAAINKKDIARAGLGAIQNRLENTITNQQIQAENLQAAESRISDVDVATEMTEFTRNNILALAATAMLAQANSLPQLALQLIG